MRKLQLLLTAFAVLVAGSFVGVSAASAQNTGDCVQSCKEDCADLPKEESKDCKFSCMGGRCGIAGIVQAAQATGEPGIDCSADGECNAFCEATPDPDCGCTPSTTPLAMTDLNVVDVTDNGLRGESSIIDVYRMYPTGYYDSWFFEIDAFVDPQIPNSCGIDNWCTLAGRYMGDFDDRDPQFWESNPWEIVPDPRNGPSTEVRLVLAQEDDPPNLRPGGTVTVFTGEFPSGITFHLPAATTQGDSITRLYVADDGSTYYDPALTDLAASACDATADNACPFLGPVVISPLEQTVGNQIDCSSLWNDPDGDTIWTRWTGTGGEFADPTARDTTYTCHEAGEWEITVEVSDKHWPCIQSYTQSVTCTENGP